MYDTCADIHLTNIKGIFKQGTLRDNKVYISGVESQMENKNNNENDDMISYC